MMINSTASIHSHALIEKDVVIGANTRVWAFAHVLSNVRIGSDCNICDHTLIESGVQLGDRVTVKSGVYIWSGVEIGDDVFIGPCVAFTNDKYPRSKQYLPVHPKTILAEGCSIGANSTLLPGIKIGAWALIGAGSVVTSDVPAYAKVYGNPAKLKGWLCRCGTEIIKDSEQIVCSCGRQYRVTSNNNELSEILI